MLKPLILRGNKHPPPPPKPQKKSFITNLFGAILRELNLTGVIIFV